MLGPKVITISLAAAIAASSLAVPAFAKENLFLPEYGTLAEHNQWSIKEIAVDQVAELGFTGAGVKVAVLDSGIALSTPGLSQKVIAYKDFLSSHQPLPDHGTQSAGIIASDFDVATGIRGVAPNASLIVGRVCQMGSCDTAAIRKGISWAVEQGAQVISMSFGGGGDPVMNAAITAAVNQGVVVVSAAGNNGCQTMTSRGINRFCKQGVISEIYSASFTIPGLISAGAIDQSRARASFSSWGPNLDLMAPGVSSVTYDPIGPTNGFGGTSAATPYIAGVAALVLSVNPLLTPVQVQAILQSSTKPALAIKPKVWDNCTKSEITNEWTCENQVENVFPQEYFTGAGIVNALSAVKLAQQLEDGQLLEIPSVTTNEKQIQIRWAGSAADLYSNNKLVARNAESGFTITGGYEQSYAFQIKRDNQQSEPKLLVLQRPIKPSAPIVTESSARADIILIGTSDLGAEADQLLVFPDQVAAVFELANGKQIACSGYSPAPAGEINRPYFFSCPAEIEGNSISGMFRLINKYSQLGPGVPVEITSVGSGTKYLEVKTTYVSSDKVVFDWDDVAGAKSYNYRYLPTGEMFCMNETQFELSGKSSQPSAFLVEARDGPDCSGQVLIQSDYHGFVLLSPRPDKPQGVTVKNLEVNSVEFDIPNSSPSDKWRIYRSDGLVVRVYGGERIAVGMQPNENVNGKTFSYRIMKVVLDTWGEVWGELSDPIVVKVRDLEAPTKTKCHVKKDSYDVSCSLEPNRLVESTLLEYLGFDGAVMFSRRTDHGASALEHSQSRAGSAHSVRVSAITGKQNEWMRRGASKTLRIQSRGVRGLTYVSQ